MSISAIQTVESRSLSNKKNEQHFSSQKMPKLERFNHLKDHFDSKCLEGSFNSNIKFSFANVQAKLKVSQPNDPYEQEADRVAEQIVGMNYDYSNARISDENKGTEIINRKCSKCEEEDDSVNEKNAQINMKVNTNIRQNEVSNETNSQINNVISNGGQLLDSQTKEFMEARFGYDFSNVRIHDDFRAIKSADSVNALAYTIGSDIVFGEAQYRPYTSEGKILLAHELTHVVQQTAKRNDSTEQYQSLYKYRIMNNGEVSRIYRYSTQDCEPNDVTSIIAPADLRATQMAIHTTALLARFLSTPSDHHVRDLLLKNFNDDKLSTIRAVYSNFRKIENELLAGDYQYECEDDCDDENAYVYSIWTDVHLCMNKLKGRPIDFIAGVIIHEMSHYAADTDDNEYFYPGSGVTTLSEDDAIENADSYEGFAARL